MKEDLDKSLAQALLRNAGLQKAIYTNALASKSKYRIPPSCEGGHV
jgi:hypothetical protein